MPLAEQPFRQIHLDFHTSEHIVGVGDAFDPDEFARTLKEARVNSINLFSRCHHGWIYHDTKFPNKHPHLKRNLLKEQINACHRAGIRAPIYITVGWDEYSARTHPEWCEVTPDGKLTHNGPLKAGWHKLCLNQRGYIDYVIAQTEEVLETLPVDGLWFDIIFQGQCCCHVCLPGMMDAGLDPEIETDRRAYSVQVVDSLRRQVTEAVRRKDTDCTIFYNAGHVGPLLRGKLEPYTHLELESLPSGGWGYDHFPLTARYARLLHPEWLGMTGKFLKSWGDFGGFKTEAGLEYDCFLSLALGGKCCVGDQLHPSGKISKATYHLIGHVYGQVEEKEPWCRKATPLSDIAVLTPEAFDSLGQNQRVSASAAGALRILHEGHHQFDIIDLAVPLENYRVVVLPDVIPIDDELRARLERYVAGGGAVLCSFESAISGVTINGESEFGTEYVVPDARLGAPATEHAMYERAKTIAPPADGVEVLAVTRRPYFNREWRHFCSHAQTPYVPEGTVEATPAVVRTGPESRIVYFAHPVFRMYKSYAARAYKQMVIGALSLLLPDPLVRGEDSSAPSTLRVTAMRQEAENRTVLHLLHYIPERRADNYEVVEDVIPLFHVALSVRADRPVSTVRTAPQGEVIPFTQENGRIRFTVPQVRGHQMVTLEG